MAQGTDGWTLLGRIASHPDAFEACGKTATLAALLIVRNQLAQGVESEEQLGDLAEIVGRATLGEVIDDLANYEVLRVLANIEGAGDGQKRTAQTARRRLHAALEREAARRAPAGEAPAAPSGQLHRHSAMGARRIRPEG